MQLANWFCATVTNSESPLERMRFAGIWTTYIRCCSQNVARYSFLGMVYIDNAPYLSKVPAKRPAVEI